MPQQQVVYCGPFDEVDVPALRLAGVRPGVPVEVSAEAAEQLFAQPECWRPASAPAVKPEPVKGA